MLTLFRDFSVTGVALYFQQRIKYFMTLNKSGVLALLGIVLVAVAIAALALSAAWSVVRQARGEIAAHAAVAAPM